MEKVKNSRRFVIIFICSMVLCLFVFSGVIFDAIERQSLAKLIKIVTLLVVLGNFRCLSKISGNGKASLFLMIISYLWGTLICRLIFVLTSFAVTVYSSAELFSVHGMGFIEFFTGLMKFLMELDPFPLCIVGGAIAVGPLVSFGGHYLFVICKDDGVIQ